MASWESFECVVIGSGQGGTPLSKEFARAGLKTAIIERHQVGGTCVNVGCTPTKAMVSSGRNAHLCSRASEYGVRISGSVVVDFAAVLGRKNGIVESFRSSSVAGLEKTENLELIRGDAAFEGPNQVVVSVGRNRTRLLKAKQIVINTGTSPLIPDIRGLEETPFFTSTSLMEADALPEHLVILGGGYIGVEFGQMFRRFGSRVSIIQRAVRLLPREDEDVAAAVTEILKDEGLDLYLGCEAANVRGEPGAHVEVQLQAADGIQSIRGSHILVATGRRPNAEALNLESAGVELDEKGYVRVNDRLETRAPGIFAIGDVKGGPAFTHISYDDYRVLAGNLLHNKQSKISGRPVPYTIFTDPQLGRIGLTEREATKTGQAYRVARLSMTHVARAIETGETRGFMKILVDPEDEQILGCAILGTEGGELMSMVQIAMMGRLRYSVLRDGVFAHPTFAESLNNVFAQLN